MFINYNELNGKNLELKQTHRLSKLLILIDMRLQKGIFN
ncbi:hypothetical protein FHR29_005223 [Sphingobacterium sp. JUb56]|nr:hypothetical protein [Sphingobacterium sp. JUb56]